MPADKLVNSPELLVSLPKLNRIVPFPPSMAIKDERAFVLRLSVNASIIKVPLPEPLLGFALNHDAPELKLHERFDVKTTEALLPAFWFKLKLLGLRVSIGVGTINASCTTITVSFGTADGLPVTPLNTIVSILSKVFELIPADTLDSPMLVPEIGLKLIHELLLLKFQLMFELMLMF